MDDSDLLAQACEEMHKHFEIDHATFQFETPAMAARYKLRSGDVV